MTKKEMFATLDGIIDDSNLENKVEVHNFIAHELELLNKRSSSSRPTATQIANDAIKNDIVDALATLGPITISELQSKDEKFDQYSNQKLNALMTQLVKSGIVKRELIKKKAYFSIVTTD
ncbi:MAG: hypothetical protein LUC37_02755 [Prevotella sp.]|nr:hypothetical protein [Prevotella sp.]